MATWFHLFGRAVALYQRVVDHLAHAKAEDKKHAEKYEQGDQEIPSRPER